MIQQGEKAVEYRGKNSALWQRRASKGSVLIEIQNLLSKAFKDYGDN
jgi:hypothetical protein